MDFVGAITREIFSVSWYWWIVSAGLILAVWRGRKEKIVEALIAGYVLLILVITLLDRPVGIRQAELIPFWSYSIPELRTEIVMNYILFIPLGVLLALKNVDWRRVWLLGASTSLIVETSQLIFRRGLFEFDDVIGNSLGCLVGAVLVVGLKKMDRMNYD